MSWRKLTSCLIAATAFSTSAFDVAARDLTIQRSIVTIQILDCSPENKNLLLMCDRQAKLRNNINNIISSDDYPSRAERQNRSGAAYFRLTADPKNKEAVGNCAIIISSGHTDLDNETCRILKRRARFEADSIDASHPGIDGRVIWIAQWTIKGGPRPESRIEFLYGEASDKPICWVNKVRREGTGFRVYLSHGHPSILAATPPLMEPSDDPNSGETIFIAAGERISILNNGHDTCSIAVIDKDGRLAVEQNAWFLLY